MPVNGKQILDPRIQVIFACAIDYRSWDDEEEEKDAIAEVADELSISIKTVKKIRAWWFEEENQLLKNLAKSIVEFSESEGCDSDEIETMEAQFESDVFGAELILFLGQHFFGEPPADDDVQFAETIEVNDVDPEDLNPHFAKFLKSSLPVEVTVKFFDSPVGSKILDLV